MVGQTESNWNYRRIYDMSPAGWAPGDRDQLGREARIEHKSDYVHLSLDKKNIWRWIVNSSPFQTLVETRPILFVIYTLIIYQLKNLLRYK